MKRIRTWLCPAARRDRLLHEIGAQISAELNLDRLLRMIVDRVNGVLGFSYCAILLKEGGDLVIRAVSEYSEEIVGKRIPLGQGISGRCAQERRETVISDLACCAHYIHLGDRVFRSEIDVPILFRDKLLGVLNLQSIHKNAFHDRDVRFIRLLSLQIGVAIHNSLVLDQMRLVQDIGLKLVSLGNPDSIFPLIVAATRERLHYDSCAVLEAQGHHLVLKASSGEFPEGLVGLKIPFGQGITGRCAQERRVINVGDVRNDSAYISSGIPGTRSEIACPVIADGELLGLLTVESKSEDAFGEDDVRLLSILSLQVAVAMRNARMYAEIEKLSVTDPLTGLFNFRYFRQRLEAELARTQRYHHPLSLIMIDLDDFKSFNDRFGHQFGDRVLREAAAVIRRNVRRYDEPMILKGGELDVIARYGGEEFIIILPDTRLEGAMACAERLRNALETRLSRQLRLPLSDGAPIRVTGSFGVADYRNGEDIDGFIKKSDVAMYQAKKQGKNRVIAAGCLLKDRARGIALA